MKKINLYYLIRISKIISNNSNNKTINKLNNKKINNFKKMLIMMINKY